MSELHAIRFTATVAMPVDTLGDDWESAVLDAVQEHHYLIIIEPGSVKDYGELDGNAGNRSNDK